MISATALASGEGVVWIWSRNHPHIWPLSYKQESLAAVALPLASWLPPSLTPSSANRLSTVLISPQLLSRRVLHPLHAVQREDLCLSSQAALPSVLVYGLQHRNDIAFAARQLAPCRGSKVIQRPHSRDRRCRGALLGAQL